MKNLILLLALAAATFGVAGSPKSEWQARYDRVTGQLNKGNLEPWKANFARQFVLVSPDGSKKSRMRFFKEVEKDLAGSKGFQGKAWIKNVTRRRGMTEVSFDFNATVKMADGQLTIHEVGVDTWQMIGGKWLTVKTVDKVLTVTPMR